MLPLEAEFFMEQRLVGWIIGRGGGTLKEIEQGYQVKVSVDQGTKEQGYSKVRISGGASLVQQAADHINTSLARAAVGISGINGTTPVGPFLTDTPPVQGVDEMYEEMRVDQKFVGWLLGKGGGVVREIEQSSGCKISINQETRNLGYSRAQLHGTFDQRTNARQLIQESLERAQIQGDGPVNRVIEDSMQIEQKWVGWILGKGGCVLKEIEEETGARVTIDQATANAGYSTVKLTGEIPQVELAKTRVTACLQKVGGNPLLNSSEAEPGTLHIEQQWVGWLLGKGGSVIREIEQATEAKVTINQDTKQLGYSVATLTGTPAAMASARDLIVEKLQRVNPEGGGVLLDSVADPPADASIDQSEALRQAFATLEKTLLPRKDRDSKNSGSFAAQLAAAAAGKLLQAVATPSQTTDQNLEMQVEQKWVGWLLGKGGQTIREIETETSAKVSIDQSTKHLGYSVVKIMGTASAVLAAQQRVQGSLALVDPSSSTGSAASREVAAPAPAPAPAPSPMQSSGEGDMQVEQKMVGWILGKAGVVLKEIEQKSGARVSIDQSTKDMGFSTVRINGNWHQSSTARLLIQDKLTQANPAG